MNEPMKSQQRTNQMSSAQVTNPQNHKQIKRGGFKPKMCTHTHTHTHTHISESLCYTPETNKTL